MTLSGVCDPFKTIAVAPEVDLTTQSAFKGPQSRSKSSAPAREQRSTCQLLLTWIDLMWLYLVILPRLARTRRECLSPMLVQNMPCSMTAMVYETDVTSLLDKSHP